MFFNFNIATPRVYGIFGMTLFVLALCIIGCRDKDLLDDNEVLNQYLNLPDEPYQYASLEIPSYLDRDLIRKQDNTPTDNVITDEGATLGRVLFYDTRLSKNNTISCASCHQQQFGFGDTARFSLGFLGGRTNRHSMGLANARYRVSKLFFWDGRAATLEDQVLMPIQDAEEMGLTLPELVDIVGNQPYYPILFNQAFGSPEISSDKISRALAQFVRSIQSFDSKYDAGRMVHAKDEDFANFSALENFGKTLFFDVRKGNCGGCHYSDAFVLDVPRNNGLDSWENPGSNDIGYQGTTQNNLDQGKFIAPSLRNIAIRPPYMHNGRFTTLDQVVDHYSQNIQWSTTLDAHLQGANQQTALQFNLTQDEKNALVAFMETLTDLTLLNDTRFSNPF